MGREIRRVPLDFSWPLSEPWQGFLMPEKFSEQDCPDCSHGYAPHAEHLRQKWYGDAPFDPAETGSTPLTTKTPAVRAFAERNVDRNPEFYGVQHGGREAAVEWEALRLIGIWNTQWSHHLSQQDVDALVDAGRLMDFTRTPRTEQQREDVRKKMEAGGNSWLPYDNGYRPTATEVNEWSLYGMGHDSLNAMIAVEARCEREGQAHRCATCNGHGSLERYPGQRDEAEAWTKEDPPEGEGWQVWETVSEGSPISPVFPTREGVIEWLTSPAYTWGASRPLTREQAEAFVDQAWAPSFISKGNTFATGDASCAG